MRLNGLSNFFKKMFVRGGLQSDETINVLRGFLATSLEDLVSMECAELCHFLANFLTLVRQWHPQASPVSCVIRDHRVVFLLAKVSYTACWWQPKSQLNFLQARMRTPDSPH